MFAFICWDWGPKRSKILRKIFKERYNLENVRPFNAFFVFAGREAGGPSVL